MDKKSRGSATINLEISDYPKFGTNYSIFENKKYFVPFIPSKNQLVNIQNSELIIDSLYHKKEIFYIHMNSTDTGGKGKYLLLIKVL